MITSSRGRRGCEARESSMCMNINARSNQESKAGPYKADGRKRRENLGIKEAVRNRSSKRAARDSCRSQEGGLSRLVNCLAERG